MTKNTFVLIWSAYQLTRDALEVLTLFYDHSLRAIFGQVGKNPEGKSPSINSSSLLSLLYPVSFIQYRVTATSHVVPVVAIV